MKALSLTRPWSILSVLGEKEWETRPGRYYHFGHTAIHTSDGFPKGLRALYPGGLEEVCQLPFFKEALAKHGYTSPDLIPVSAVVGFVEIVRYVKTDRIRDKLSEKELAFGLYGNGRWAYQMQNPKLIKPVACKGAQGLWDVPARVMDEIRAQNPQLDLSTPYSLPI